MRDDELPAPEVQVDHWQFYPATEDRVVRGVEIPAGSHYALHWRAGGPPVVAPTAEALMAALDELEQAQRSVMAEVLGAEITRLLQTSPGRWHLPGPPP